MLEGIGLRWFTQLGGSTEFLALLLPRTSVDLFQWRGFQQWWNPIPSASPQPSAECSTEDPASDKAEAIVVI